MRRFALVALLLGVATATAGLTEGRTAPRSGLALDVQLAFDGTGSMGSLIAQAQDDAQAIVDAVREADPSARFSVVAFRDPGYAAPEYEILQPFTANVAAVKAGVGRVRAVSTSDPNNVPSEAYNLALNRSITDARLGWRPASRKVVVVFGDAEPHGAGNAGLAGCRDRAPDSHGLSTTDVLAAMRASGRTLLMVRGPSSEASLRCYSSIAALAGPGGAARNAGSADLAGPIRELLQGALLTSEGIVGFPVALPSTKRRVTFTIRNVSGGRVRLEGVTLRLPSGMRFAGSRGLSRPTVSGRTVSWSAPRDLAPDRVIRIAPLLAVGDRRGSRAVSLTTRATFADTRHVSTPTKVLLRVGRTVAVRLVGAGSTPLARGATRLSYPPRAGSLMGAVQAAGKLTVGTGTSATKISVRSARVRSTVTPARYELSAFVISSRRPSCQPGTTATVVLVDHDVIRPSTTPDVIRVLGAGCATRVPGDVVTS